MYLATLERTEKVRKARMKFKIGIFAAALALAMACGLPARAEKLDGREIAQRVFDRDTGRDSYATVKMLLVDKRGNKKPRSLVMATKEYEDLNKSYTRFTTPADIEGTAFLTWENRGRDDDQFLYLPSLKRVRRIVASQKKSRFVNTDYTYEDMQTREVDEDRHRLLREEKYMDYDCWVVESVPVAPDGSQYGKRVGWIAKEAEMPIRTDYYDKKGRKVKIYRAAVLKRIDGIWTASEYEMSDLERKHRTLVKLTGIEYNSGLEDRIFTKTYLQYAN